MQRLPITPVILSLDTIQYDLLTSSLNQPQTNVRHKIYEDQPALVRTLVYALQNSCHFSSIDFLNHFRFLRSTLSLLLHTDVTRLAVCVSYWQLSCNIKLCFLCYIVLCCSRNKFLSLQNYYFCKAYYHSHFCKAVDLRDTDRVIPTPYETAKGTVTQHGLAALHFFSS